MKHRLEKCTNLEIKQGTVEELVLEGDKITGVTTKEGISYNCKALILSSGTFMKGFSILEIQIFRWQSRRSAFYRTSAS